MWESTRKYAKVWHHIRSIFWGWGGGVKVFLSTALPVSKRPKVVYVCVCVCEGLEREREGEGEGLSTKREMVQSRIALQDSFEFCPFSPSVTFDWIFSIGDTLTILRQSSLKAKSCLFNPLLSLFSLILMDFYLRDPIWLTYLILWLRRYFKNSKD